MKRLLGLAVALTLLFTFKSALAVDISVTFGTGTHTCVFAVSAPNIPADSTTVSTLTLSVDGMPYLNPIGIEEMITGQVKAGVTIPAAGIPLTASATGTWQLAIVSPAPLAKYCPQIMLQAH